MIISLLEWLSNPLQLNPVLTLTASFIWGILSIF